MIFLYFFLFSLNAVIIITNSRIEYKKNSPFSVFWLAYFFNYFIYTAFDYGEYTFQATAKTVVVSVDPEVLLNAQIFILLFNFLSFIYLVFSKTTFLHLAPLESSKVTSELLPFFVTLFFVSRMFYKLYTGEQDQGFADIRANANVTSLLIDTYFKYVFVGIVIYYFAVYRHFYGGILLLLLLADFLMFGGGRQFFLLALIGILSVLFLVKRYSFFAFFLSFALIPAGVLLAKILVFLRNLGDYQARLDFLSSFDWQLIQKSTTNEYDLRFAFYHFIERQNELPDAFFSLNYFLRVLFFWLPSSLSLGFKPDDFEYEMYAVYAREYGGSLHATFHGSIFADSGWFILPWLMLFIIVRELSARLVHKTSRSGNIIFWFSLIYLSIMWARGSIYAPIVVNFFILIFLFFIVTFVKLFKPHQLQANSYPLSQKSSL